MYISKLCHIAYIVSNIHLQEPVERKLGHRIIPDNTDSTRHHKRVSDYMYEVPLLSSLQKLLSDQPIREDV